jgi:hypothetical protein
MYNRRTVAVDIGSKLTVTFLTNETSYTPPPPILAVIDYSRTYIPELIDFLQHLDPGGPGSMHSGSVRQHVHTPITGGGGG